MEAVIKKCGSDWQVLIHNLSDGEMLICTVAKEGLAHIVRDSLAVVLSLHPQCEFSRYDRDQAVMQEAYYQILHIGQELENDHANNYRPSDPIRDWL
jgi:hypothetical protein